MITRDIYLREKMDGVIVYHICLSLNKHKHIRIIEMRIYLQI